MTLSTRHSPSYTETINFQLKTIESKTDSAYSVMMHASHRHHRPSPPQPRNYPLTNHPRSDNPTTPYLISRRQQHRKLSWFFVRPDGGGKGEKREGRGSIIHDVHNIPGSKPTHHNVKSTQSYSRSNYSWNNFASTLLFCKLQASWFQTSCMEAPVDYSGSLARGILIKTNWQARKERDRSIMTSTQLSHLWNAGISA